jgi:hypothetical protein
MLLLVDGGDLKFVLWLFFSIFFFDFYTQWWVLIPCFFFFSVF